MKTWLKWGLIGSVIFLIFSFINSFQGLFSLSILNIKIIFIVIGFSTGALVGWIFSKSFGLQNKKLLDEKEDWAVDNLEEEVLGNKNMESQTNNKK